MILCCKHPISDPQFGCTRRFESQIIEYDAQHQISISLLNFHKLAAVQSFFTINSLCRMLIRGRCEVATAAVYTVFFTLHTWFLKIKSFFDFRPFNFSDWNVQIWSKTTRNRSVAHEDGNEVRKNGKSRSSSRWIRFYCSRYTTKGAKGTKIFPLFLIENSWINFLRFCSWKTFTFPGISHRTPHL